VDKELSDLLAAFRAKEPPRRRWRWRRCLGWPSWLLLAMVGGCAAFTPWWFLPAWFALGLITAALFVIFVRLGRRSWAPKPARQEVPHADTGR
jgi:hypothetical protein